MDDWAIVVGITDYPDLGTLGGPERGATDFFNWVTSPKPEGGGIDPQSNRARLIITSKCVPPPPYGDFINAQPMMSSVTKVFTEIFVQSQQNHANNEGVQVGKRLYLYFAGHGFEPAGAITQGQAALLMADSADGIFGNHVPGTAWAEWFYKAGFFEEVLLFMDCCRDYLPGIAANPVIFKEQIGGEKLKKKRLYCYATDWAKKSWEREMDFDKKIHGVFSATLMKGLSGAACDRFTGEITTDSLRGYLKEAMQFYFSSEDQKNPAISKEPRLPDFGDEDFVIATVTKIPVYQINLNLPPEFQNKSLELNYGSGKQLHKEILTSNGAVLSLNLSRGFYTLSINEPGGIATGFQVNGIGAEDVSL